MKEYTSKAELTNAIKAYQVGWTTLLLKWEKDEKIGLEVHINTVAPFGTFRTKIRKWKKLALQKN